MAAEPTEVEIAKDIAKTNTYKKCHSQFSDTADYRRFGRNTWQDESGVYANSALEHELFPLTSTIPPQLESSF